MPHSNANAADLLTDHLALFRTLKADEPVLDLACGNGRNGLFLAKHNVPVIFADNSKAALDEVSRALDETELTGQCWHVDFEVPGQSPLLDKSFAAILVFNYLHRPLFESLRQAICPGGLIMYETFTDRQPEFGRPTNPDFLLKPGELASYFADWQVLQEFEGVREQPRRAVASLIARKP